MDKILIDLGKLKDLNSGLGQVSLNFGQGLSLVSNPSDFALEYLVPSEFNGTFGTSVSYTELSLMKRWFPFLNKRYALWHAIHQDSGYMPVRGVPYVLTIHDLNFMYEKSTHKANKRLDVLKRKIDRANHLVFISHFAQNEASKFIDLKNKPRSIIYNGVKAPDITNIQKPSWLPDRPFLFSLGVIRPKKNIHVLVEMMRVLKDQVLVIAGNDHHAYADQIRESILKYDLKDRVILAGSISEQEKNYLYHFCEAFLFPSLYEGFGLPLIEAMYCGKPVFSSTCTSLPEIGGDVAYYWESFDPVYMSELLSSKMEEYTSNKEHYKTKFHLHASQFTWNENVNAHLNLYQSLLKG